MVKSLDMQGARLLKGFHTVQAVIFIGDLSYSDDYVSVPIF